MSRHSKEFQSDHPVTEDNRSRLTDHPAGGALHPVHGTVEAPILVVGATGTIGRAVVGALATAGRPVVAVAPNPERLETLRLEHCKAAVTLRPGRILTDSDAAQLADELRAAERPLGGVVVAIPAGVTGGRVLDRPVDDLRRQLDASLLAQLSIARHLVPLLAESGRNGTYVMIGGPGSDAPWAGYGQRSIAMAALRMLARVLHDEAQSLGVRVHLLSIDSPVRSEQPTAHECPEWPTVSGVGRRVAQLITRAHVDEATQTIVTCRRRADQAVSNAAQPPRRFRDVPTFLQSLKTQTST